MSPLSPTSRAAIRCCAALTLGSVIASVAVADAFDLLESTFRAYAGLSGYVDRGELVSSVRRSDGTIEERFEFETRVGGDGGFLFRVRSVDSPGNTQVTWIEDDTVWQWESGAAGPRMATSVGLALANSLGIQAVDALFVPLAAIGDTDLLPTADAATIEGSEACDDSTCDIMAVSHRGGRSVSRMWIDRETGLVRRLEVDHFAPPGSALRDDEPQHSLRIVHRVDALDAPVARESLVFRPPREKPDTDPAPEQASQVVIRDEISVRLKTLAVRALDSSNRPVPNLEPSDFEVRLGREEIPVVAVDWVSSSGESLDPLSPSALSPPSALAPRNEEDGNLIVFFVQSHFNPVRVKGHLRVLPFVREFLDSLEPGDWTAVVSFDSHLKLWHDFSRDRRSTGDAIERAIRFGALEPIRPNRGRSLARSFPREEARRAANPEDALRLTARSLIDIPGEKVIIYLGWGLGRYGSSGFQMTRDYSRTLAALDRANASVFVIDVTDADYHTLEIGIRKVAEDTGGTYAKTNRFARREMLRLSETVSGYYLLTLESGRLPEERRKLEVTLRNREGRVFLRDRQLSR